MTTRPLPVLDYSDAFRILRLEGGNGTIVNDASEQVMLRIEKTMARLKVMGDDARRNIWVRAKWYSNRLVWLKISSAHYEGFHYLVVSDGEDMFVTLKNKEFISSTEKEDYDLTAPLLSLEKSVTAVVDWICDAPEEYNAYVERYLPYSKRSGDIPRRVLYEIDPEWEDTRDYPRLIAELEELKKHSPTLYDTQNLRTFISVWCIAFRAHTKMKYDLVDDKDYDYLFRFEKDRWENCLRMSDLELFEYYNDKGSQIAGLDLDSQEDYLKWYHSNMNYHCSDISYTRIRLLYHSEDYGKTGPYRFYLKFDYSRYFKEVAEVAVALFKQGIVVELHDLNGILKTLRLEDLVGFRPFPYHYKHREAIAEEFHLPRQCEITREKYWRIVHATKWYKQPKAMPIRRKNN